MPGRRTRSGRAAAPARRARRRTPRRRGGDILRRQRLQQGHRVAAGGIDGQHRPGEGGRRLGRRRQAVAGAEQAVGGEREAVRARRRQAARAPGPRAPRATRSARAARLPACAGRGRLLLGDPALAERDQLCECGGAVAIDGERTGISGNRGRAEPLQLQHVAELEVGVGAARGQLERAAIGRLGGGEVAGFLQRMAETGPRSRAAADRPPAPPGTPPWPRATGAGRAARRHGQPESRSSSAPSLSPSGRSLQCLP